MATDTEPDSEAIEEDFEPAQGSVPQEIDMADEGHPVREALGESAHRELEAHEGSLGERFAFRYEKAREFLREYLANAETGCIRTCRLKLREHDSETYDDEWFDSHTIEELIAEAKDVTGYRPVIETYESPQGSSMDRFRIEDNGIGISIEEFIALKKLGLSASHDEGGQLGAFGQGVMSVYPAIGKHGEGTLETWSRLDGANYRERFRITGFNDLPGKRESPGTTWSFPTFSDEAEPIDIQEAIEEYTTAMYVPVLHHVHDEDGVEIEKEEYTPDSLDEALLDDDSPRFVYEDEELEVVMSPDIKSDDQQVFLVSMPIEPGCDLKSFEAPYPFHVRFKHEDGRIYRSTRKPDDEGLIPVTASRYENELVDDRGAVTPSHLVPGDLVGYEHDEYDQIQVPTGVDDELVAGLDGVTINSDLGAYGGDITFDTEFDPIVAKGPNEGTPIVQYDEWVDIETSVPETYIPYDDIEEPTASNMFDGDGELVDGIDIVTPQPVDDRARLEENDGALFWAASQFVTNEFVSQAAERFQDLADNGFDQFFEFNDEEVRTAVMAFRNYVSEGRNGITDQVVRKQVEFVFDVSIDGQLAEQLTILSDSVELVDRNCGRPESRRNREQKTVARVLQDTGSQGDTYMAATMHAEKAQLAWALGNNNEVVAVDNASMYDDYAELLGWIPMKTLDLRGIKDKYDIDDELAEQLERTKKDIDHDYEGHTMDDLEAESREIKLRTRKERRYSSKTPKEVKEAFEDGESVRDRDGIVTYLLVFKENDVSGVQVGHDACNGAISRTIVPEYVAEYLEDVPRCYVCDGADYSDEVHEIVEDMQSQSVETIDVSSIVEREELPTADSFVDDEYEITVDVDSADQITYEETTYGELGATDMGLVLPARVTELIESDIDVDREWIYAKILDSIYSDDYDQTIERLVIVDQDDVETSYHAWDPIEFGVQSPDLIYHTDASFKLRGLDTTRWNPDNSLKIDILLPPDRFDRDAEEWTNIVKGNTRAIKKDYDKGEALVNLLHRLAEHVPDDEPVFPSNVG